MKKIIIFIILILICTGCGKKETNKNIDTNKKTNTNTSTNINNNIIENKYKDENTTPISLYKLKGNKLEKISNLQSNFSALEDIDTLQIFPSTEETIILNDSFANEYMKQFQQYNNIKVGFSISFTIDTNENIYFNILSPTNTMDKWEYIMTYLYDDYANRGKGFYSHIENDYDENTVFTAIKLQYGAYIDKVISPIELSVFTYDDLDDFENNIYRGNSKYSIKICNNSCE